MKEIRYLAVLNHPNLIQYYYAWNESPPAGWQEEQDKTLLVRNNINTRYSLFNCVTYRLSNNIMDLPIFVIAQQRNEQESCGFHLYVDK